MNHLIVYHGTLGSPADSIEQKGINFSVEPDSPGDLGQGLYASTSIDRAWCFSDIWAHNCFKLDVEDRLMARIRSTWDVPQDPTPAEELYWSVVEPILQYNNSGMVQEAELLLKYKSWKGIRAAKIQQGIRLAKEMRRHGYHGLIAPYGYSTTILDCCLYDLLPIRTMHRCTIRKRQLGDPEDEDYFLENCRPVHVRSV